MTLMNAIVRSTYGPPDSLVVQQIERPAVDDDAVIVRVHAASVNPLDWHNLTGTPLVTRLQAGIRKPKAPLTLGVDMAGRVEEVGKNVQAFHPGDEVFGGSGGSFADFVSVPENGIAHKPANLTFEQAAAVPVAGLTALQALRNKANVQPGQKVLINGAAGGVGTFAVQIAKVLGAEVTGVCSTRNVEATLSLGADHVVDYGLEDFSGRGDRYDVILDNVGNRSLSDCRRCLEPGGTYVVCSGPKRRWLGPLGRFAGTALTFAFLRQKGVPFLAQIQSEDLVTLRQLIEKGAVLPVIDRRYALQDAAKALQYLELGHAQGKIVLDVAQDGAKD